MNVRERIVSELKSGPLPREPLAKRLSTTPEAELDDALFALQAAGAIALRGLRYHFIDGASIDQHAPAPDMLPADPQQPKGISMKTKYCRDCGLEKPLDQFAKHARRCKSCGAKEVPPTPVQTSATSAPKKKRRKASRRKSGGPGAKLKRNRAVADVVTIPAADSLRCAADKNENGIWSIELTHNNGEAFDAQHMQLDRAQARGLRDWLASLDLGS